MIGSNISKKIKLIQILLNWRSTIFIEIKGNVYTSNRGRNLRTKPGTVQNRETYNNRKHINISSL